MLELFSCSVKFDEDHRTNAKVSGLEPIPPPLPASKRIIRFDRVSFRRILCPHPEVVYEPGIPKLVAAVGTTLMDLAVIGYWGPLLWRTWAEVCPAPIGLLLLAVGMAFTLMDIWSRC